MSINIEVRGSTARITISGPFTFPLHRKFMGAYTPLIKNSTVRSIEIELNKVDYLDSSALGMLMLLNERANVPNKPVMLLNPSSVISRFLDVANFNRYFEIRYAT